MALVRLEVLGKINSYERTRLDNHHNAIPKETLEKVLDCYHLTIEDISDRLICYDAETDELDDLIGDLGIEEIRLVIQEAP